MARERAGMCRVLARTWGEAEHIFHGGSRSRNVGVHLDIVGRHSDAGGAAASWDQVVRIRLRRERDQQEAKHARQGLA